MDDNAATGDLISKRGPIVIARGVRERPAARKELETAQLVTDDGPAFVKSPDGLIPCTIADLRSAVGRLNQKKQKTHRGGFYDPEAARLAARRSHSARRKRTKS
jgi:hypothetical protein